MSRLGDAAASSDPTRGQGVALTLRDACVLRDALLYAISIRVLYPGLGALERRKEAGRSCAFEDFRHHADGGSLFYET